MRRKSPGTWRKFSKSAQEEATEKKEIESIEADLDEMYGEGTEDFGRKVSNPRRAAMRSFGRTRYVPTTNGYRVLNGRHSGRHYTVNDFGQMCKMALILDHM